MELNLENRITLVWLLKIVLLSAIVSVSLSQTVTVHLTEPIYYSDPATATATLTCVFSIDDGTYNFFNLEWRINRMIVADFYNGAADPLYQNYCSTSSDCSITRTDTASDFIISSLDMTKNKNEFICLVTYRKLAVTKDDQDTASLIVVVPTNTMEILNGSSSVAFTNGSEVDLSLYVPEHIFQCVVAGINPKATFNWTVGGEQLVPSDHHVVDSVTGLTTSTSNVTLSPKPDYDTQQLICRAWNYEDDPQVMFHLVLKVADVCDGVHCKNGATCVPDPNYPSMPKCICPQGFQGPRCETDICDDVDCMNGGTCVPDPSDPSMPKCICAEGFQGSRCETDNSSAERTSFRIEMIVAQCLAWMAFNYLYF